MKRWTIFLTMLLPLRIFDHLRALVTLELQIMQEFQFNPTHLTFLEWSLTVRTHFFLSVFRVPIDYALGAEQFLTLTTFLRLLHDFRANHAQPVVVYLTGALELFLCDEILDNKVLALV